MADLLCCVICFVLIAWRVRGRIYCDPAYSYVDGQEGMVGSGVLMLMNDNNIGFEMFGCPGLVAWHSRRNPI